MSDSIAELEALRSGRGVVDRSDRGFVRVSGPDAFSFLQALVSADLDPVADGEGVTSLLLHPQGKLDVAFRLVRVGDEAWLDTDPGLAPRLVTSLERFKIRVDAQIADRSDEWGMLTVMGAEPRESHGSVQVVPTASGFDLVGPRAEIVTSRDELSEQGLTSVGAVAYEAFRIEQGVPVQPADVDESTIPQEAELELDAVSFTKGCFLGQELVCRIDSRGHVNRFLRRLVAIEGERPVPGAEIVVEGKVVGAVTSVTPEPFGPVALGYVRREVEPSATVDVRSPNGSATARVEPLRPV
jgi:tRNA-modifying protein YgfZ